MPLPVWARFLCYGVIGVAFEILFTGAKALIFTRDWTLKGKSYVWMIPIYGLAVFLFEPTHDRIRFLFWPLRGIIYAAGLFLVEFLTGWLLRITTGKCPWDYSGKKYSFLGLIRWDYAPIWFGFCLALEQIHDFLLRLQYM